MLYLIVPRWPHSLYARTSGNEGGPDERTRKWALADSCVLISKDWWRCLRYPDGGYRVFPPRGKSASLMSCLPRWLDSLSKCAHPKGQEADRTEVQVCESEAPHAHDIRWPERLPRLFAGK